MFTVLNLSFFLEFIYFLFASFLAFYIPGNLLVRKLKLTVFPQTILSIVVGMSLWGVQGFIFGYLNMRFLSYIYLFLAFLIWVYIGRKTKLLKKVSFRRFVKHPDYLAAFIISLGMLIQLLGVWFMGVRFADGVHLCCGQISDNILEIGIINQIIKHFPPFEPGMAGVYITNYHYWSHLVVGEMIRVFNLPLIATSFQFFPIFLSLFLGLFAIAIGNELGLGKGFIRWLLFFLYFSGDFAYFIFFALGKGFEAPISSMENGSQFLMNYPRAFAIIIFLAGLFLLLKWIKKKDYFTGFLVALLLGCTIGFKVYIGIFALSGLGFLFLYFLFTKKFKMLPPIISAFLLAVVIYLPVNLHSGGIFFTAFWRVEDFIVLPTLGLSRLMLAEQIYSAHHSVFRVAEYELIFTGLYLLTTFGTKLLGLIQSKKSLSRFPLALHIFLIPAMIVSLGIGLFFWQKVGGANSFNFIVTVIIISSLYTALACFYWLSKMNTYIRVILTVVIILLTIPRVVNAGVIDNYRRLSTDYILLSNQDLSALQYLRRDTNNNAIVLVDPHILLDKDAPYVSYMGDRPMFLSGQGDELSAHGIDFSERLGIVNSILEGTDTKTVTQVLKKNNIQYLYLLSSTKLPVRNPSVVFRPVFKNSKITILQVLGK